MTLATIRTQIQTEIGGRTDQNTLIDDSINFAYEEIATTLEIKELQKTAYTTTVDEQYQYLLPSDCYAVFWVKNETDNDLLEEATMRQFDELDETDTGTPTKWARWGENSLFIFDSVPNDNDGDNYVIKIRYWIRVTRLSVDGDDHLLPNEFEHGVRLLAAANVHLSLNDLERSALRNQDYQRWLIRFETPRSIENKNAHKSRLHFPTR